MEIIEPQADRPNQSPGVPPKSWLIESVLVTVFCCQILGIIGIVYAASVEGLYYKGDVAGAERASHTAKQMVIWSVVLGVLIMAAIMLIYGAAFFAAIMSR
ncbi:MAG: CD225/dispanin family protein [Chryseobacterium sp.]|nr:MAG: CD225/dispanin family protein [Chryseobacterium sp.]